MTLLNLTSAGGPVSLDASLRLAPPLYEAGFEARGLGVDVARLVGTNSLPENAERLREVAAQGRGVLADLLEGLGGLVDPLSGLGAPPATAGEGRIDGARRAGLAGDGTETTADASMPSATQMESAIKALSASIRMATNNIGALPPPVVRALRKALTNEMNLWREMLAMSAGCLDQERARLGRMVPGDPGLKATRMKAATVFTNAAAFLPVSCELLTALRTIEGPNTALGELPREIVYPPEHRRLVQSATDMMLAWVAGCPGGGDCDGDVLNMVMQGGALLQVALMCDGDENGAVRNGLLDLAGRMLDARQRETGLGDDGSVVDPVELEHASNRKLATIASNLVFAHATLTALGQGDVNSMAMGIKAVTLEQRRRLLGRLKAVQEARVPVEILRKASLAHDIVPNWMALILQLRAIGVDGTLAPALERMDGTVGAVTLDEDAGDVSGLLEEANRYIYSQMLPFTTPEGVAYTRFLETRETNGLRYGRLMIAALDSMRGRPFGTFSREALCNAIKDRAAKDYEVFARRFTNRDGSIDADTVQKHFLNMTILVRQMESAKLLQNGAGPRRGAAPAGGGDAADAALANFYASLPEWTRQLTNAAAAGDPKSTR